MTQQPSIGRIVLYTDRDGSTYPAIITSVIEDRDSADLVTLSTFKPGTLPGYIGDARTGAAAAIDRTDVPTPGHWHWPPRTETTDAMAALGDEIAGIVMGKP